MRSALLPADGGICTTTRGPLCKTRCGGNKQKTTPRGGLEADDGGKPAAFRPVLGSELMNGDQSNDERRRAERTVSEQCVPCA
jgi:hypothetical protein